MARTPGSARSVSGRTTDAPARATPYHAPKPRNTRASRSAFLLPGPDRPPGHVVGLPAPGVHPALGGAPPAPGSPLALSGSLAQQVAQAATHLANTAGGLPAALGHPQAPAPAPMAAAAPGPAAAAQAPATPDPYAGLDPEVASLLRGLDAQTQQEAAAIQAVNAAAGPAATQFANQLTQGMGQLTQLAGTPATGGAMPSDVPANVAALPGVISQQGQQEALAQAAQAVGGAYNLPAQIQAAGMGDLAQFYGGANQSLESMLSGIATEQMKAQSDTGLEQMKARSAKDVAQTGANARAQAANTAALARILSAQIASGHYADANKTALKLQQLRNTGAANVAGIHAGATLGAAQARSAAPKGAIGPFPAGTRAPSGYTAVTGTDGSTYFVKPPSGAAAGKPVSSSVVKAIDAAWSGKSTKNPAPGAGSGSVPAFVTQGAISSLPYDQQGAELLRAVSQYGLPPAQAWRLLKSKLTADQVRNLQYANPTTLGRQGTFARDLKQAQKIYKRFYEQRVLPGGKPATGSADDILTAMVPALARLVGLDGAEEMLKQAIPDAGLQQWAAAHASLLQQLQAR